MSDFFFSKEEKLQYIRHFLLDEVGVEGQKKLKQSSILCVGAGGLGCPALLYLAAAGVGHIGIIDSDKVESSNLQRQVLYNSNDVGRWKAEVSKQKLLDLNPHIKVEAIPGQFTAENAERLLSQFDAIMDATDNFSTRYLVNDVAVKLGKPNFFGCIFKFSGQVAVFGHEKGCYRCLFPQPPSEELAPDCARAGVIGALPGVVGTYQALEFIKWKLNIGVSLIGKILFLDTLKNKFEILEYRKDPDCFACSDPKSIVVKDNNFVCITKPSPKEEEEISVADLNKKIVNKNNFILIDVREPLEYQIGNLGGVLIPIKELEQSDLLPKNKDLLLIVHCKSGVRSARACIMLTKMGYKNVLNVKGGILAWQREIDSGIKV